MFKVTLLIKFSDLKIGSVQSLFSSFSFSSVKKSLAVQTDDVLGTLEYAFSGET